MQIVNLDGQAIPDVPYEITHNKQGQEKVIVQGKTDQEGKTKEIPYQHAGKDVTIKLTKAQASVCLRQIYKVCFW